MVVAYVTLLFTGNIARSTNAGILNYSGTILSFFIRAVEATRCIDRGEVGVEEFP